MTGLPTATGNLRRLVMLKAADPRLLLLGADVRELLRELAAALAEVEELRERVARIERGRSDGG